MALNPYFSNYSVSTEQALLDSLGVEAIQIYGLDVYYLQRKHTVIDPVYQEDTGSYFDNATVIEMLIKNFEGYGFQSDLMTKFGMQMNDKLILCVMMSRFATIFPDMTRPVEGDLIYIPMTNAIFEIRFVEHERNFYQLGKLTFYELTCERFNYNSESFTTGVPAIDILPSKYLLQPNTFNMIDQSNNSFEIETGQNLLLDDLLDDVILNDAIQHQQEKLVDFSITNPFSENRGPL